MPSPPTQEVRVGGLGTSSIYIPNLSLFQKELFQRLKIEHGSSNVNSETSSLASFGVCCVRHMGQQESL